MLVADDVDVLDEGEMVTEKDTSNNSNNNDITYSA